MGLGLDAKLYYGAPGATATTEIKNVKDVDLKLGKGEADVTTRASGGWSNFVGTLKSPSIDFKMLKPVSAAAKAAFDALQNSYLNNTPIAILCLDAEDGEGLDADCEVFTFDRNEPLDGEIEYSVSLKPTRSTRVPTWKTAAAEGSSSGSGSTSGA